MKFLIACLLVLSPGLIHAAPAGEGTVMPRVRVGAGISEAIQSKFDKAARKAAARTTKLKTSKKTKAALKKAGQTAAKCADATCGRTLAEAAGARFTVMVHITSEDEIYKVTVAVFDAATDQVTSTESETCELCAVGEVTDITIPRALSRVDAALKAPVPVEEKPKVAGLEIKTTPPGAEVEVNGIVEGRTPLKLNLKPGTYSVKITQVGYEVEERQIKVASEPQVVEIPLKVVAETNTAMAQAEGPVDRTGSYAGWGWGLTAGGVIFTGLALYLIDLDGEVTCDDGRGRTECPDVYNTRWGGAGALGLGAAAIGIGITLLVLDPGGVPTEPTPSVGPTADGKGAVFTWGGAF